MRLSAPLIALAALCLTACGPSKADVADLAASKAAADAYIAKNAKEDGVKTLKSGVQYVVVKSGPATGPHPKVADEVKVHYEGKLVDGKVFDSSYERGVPAVMSLSELIPAWKEALAQMRPGDEWRLIVPPEQGYGEDGAGGGEIPPNSVLIFRIELIDILAHPDVSQG